MHVTDKKTNCNSTHMNIFNHDKNNLLYAVTEIDQ